MLVVLFVAAVVAVAVLAIVSSGSTLAPPAGSGALQLYCLESPQPQQPEHPSPEMEPVETQPQEFQPVVRKPNVPPYPWKLPEWSIRLMEVLERPVSAYFEETPIDEALHFVQDMTGANIAIDSKVHVEDLCVTISVKRIKVRYLLALVLSADRDLAYELRPQGIYVTTREYVRRCEAQEILKSIERAREALAECRQGQGCLDAPSAAVPHEFDWSGKSVAEALKQIKRVYSINYKYQGVDEWDLQLGAPRGRWKGNAAEALRRLLGHVQLAYEVCGTGSEGFIRITTPAWLSRVREARKIRKTAFRDFGSTPIGSKVEDKKLHKLIQHLDDLTNVRVIPDRATWDTGIRVSLPGENSTIKELLDYLRKKHGIKYWFELDCDTGRETLFLLKSP